MQERNGCHTYFLIVGKFDPDEISRKLNLKPEKSWKIGDKRRNGTRYDFSHFEVGRCDNYDPIVANQMLQTISVVKDRVSILKQIREENEVEFFLVVVPTIYAGGINPCLSPTLEIIDFCHETRTQIDIDTYIYDSTDE